MSKRISRLLLCLWMLMPASIWANDEVGLAGDTIRGNVGFLLPLAPLLEGFQYIHASQLSHDPTAESGVGFTLDFADARGNAVAVDYYQVSQEASRSYVQQGNRRSYNDSIRLFGFMLGYRYHYPLGFYSGLGLWYPNVTIRKNDHPGRAPATIVYRPEFIPIISLGINGDVANGFTLGAHIIYSFPATLELASGNDITNLVNSDYVSGGGELSDIQVTSLHFKIGYSW